MNEPTNDNDIDALLAYLKLSQPDPRWAHSLTALVAERDKLREQLRLANIDQCNTEAEANDRDRDLRERLVESALQGAARDAHMHHEASSMGTRAVYMVDAAIAAMRKGVAHE